MSITIYTIPQDLKKGDLIAISESGEINIVNFPKNDLRINPLSKILPNKRSRLILNRRPTYKLQMDREKIIRSLDSGPRNKVQLVKSILGSNPDKLKYTYLVDDLNSLIKVSKKISLNSDGLYSQVK